MVWGTRWAGIAAALWLSLVAARAHAQTADPPQADAADAPAAEAAAPNEARDQEARALYQAGVVAFEDGRFEDALGYFERSHELSGRPELLYNIGTSADRLRRNAQALEAFRAYLDALPDAENRRSVERRIEVLEEATARGETAHVPTPEEAAAGALGGPGGGEAPAGATATDVPAPRRTGLWVGLGVAGAAIVAGVVLAVVLVSRDDGGFQEPDADAVFTTLRRGP